MFHPSLLFLILVPPGMCLDLLLNTLMIYGFLVEYLSNCIVNFLHDMAVVGIITHSDESKYWQKVEKLEVWYKMNNLYISIRKTKKKIVNFREKIVPLLLLFTFGVQI